MEIKVKQVHGPECNGSNVVFVVVFSLFRLLSIFFDVSQSSKYASVIVRAYLKIYHYQHSTRKEQQAKNVT